MLEKEASKWPPQGVGPNQSTRVGRRRDPAQSRVLDACVSSLTGGDGALGLAGDDRQLTLLLQDDGRARIRVRCHQL